MFLYCFPLVLVDGFLPSLADPLLSLGVFGSFVFLFPWVFLIVWLGGVFGILLFLRFCFHIACCIRFLLSFVAVFVAFHAPPHVALQIELDAVSHLRVFMRRYGVVYHFLLSRSPCGPIL